MREQTPLFICHGVLTQPRILGVHGYFYVMSGLFVRTAVAVMLTRLAGLRTLHLITHELSGGTGIPICAFNYMVPLGHGIREIAVSRMASEQSDIE